MRWVTLSGCCWLEFRMRTLTRFLVCILSIILSCPAVTAGQAPQAPPPISLKIVPLQGEGAVNAIRTRTVTEPVVEVRDERDLPVAGAEVVFQLPATGPGGVFPDRTRTFKTTTNSQGQAAGPALIPDSQPGRFHIQVTATKAGQTATLVMSQQNSVEMVAVSHRSHHAWIFIVVAGAAAVGTGLYFLLRGSTPNSLSVSSGPITVGGPH